MTIFLKPSPDVLVFMVRGIILNEDRLSWEISGSQLLFQIRSISLCVEDRSALVEKSGRKDVDRSKNFEGLSLACHRDKRLGSTSRPSPMEGGVLTETGFVLVNQTGFLPLGFFLISGYVSRIQPAFCRASARAKRRLGRCTENPNSWSILRTCPG